MSILQRMRDSGRYLLHGIHPRIDAPDAALETLPENAHEIAMADALKDRLYLFFMPMVKAMNGNTQAANGDTVSDPEKRAYGLTISTYKSTDGSLNVKAVISHFNAREMSAHKEFGTAVADFLNLHTARNGITRAALAERSIEFFAPVEGSNRMIMLSSREREAASPERRGFFNQSMGAGEVIVALQNKFPETTCRLLPFLTDNTTLGKLTKILHTPVTIEP